VVSRERCLEGNSDTDSSDTGSSDISSDLKKREIDAGYGFVILPVARVV
jgi:hypothetical protein